MGDLERKISAVKRRLRLFRILDWALWALILGLAASVLVVAALKLFPNSIDPMVVSASITGGFLLAGIIGAFLTRLTKFDAAQRADSQLGLNERLSSALLLHRDGEMQPAYAALEEDARRYAQAIRPGKDFRYRTPPHAKHVIWPLAALFAVYFLMPQFDLFAGDQAQAKSTVQKQEAIPDEVAKEEAKRIREIAKQAKATEEGDADAKDLQLAERLERLSRDLELNKKNKNELVAEMSRLNEDMNLRKRDITKKTQPFKQIKGLQNAEKTRDIQQNLKQQDFRNAQQQMQDLADMFQKQDLSSEEMKQIAQEMKNLAEEVKENKALSDALDKAAEEVEKAAEEKKKQEQQQQDQSQQQQQQQGQQQQSQQQQDQGQGQEQQQQQQSGQQQQNQQGDQAQSGQQKQPNQQGQGQQQQQSQGSQQQQQAQQDAAAAMQQAAQQMGEMQSMMNQMQQLSEMQSQLQQSQSQCMNPQSGSGSKPSSSGQKQSSQQGQSPQNSGQPNSTPNPNSQCSSCNGQGCSNCGGGGSGQWQSGDSPNENDGSGGPGRGRGGIVPDDGTMAMGFEDVFIPGQKNDGEIIAVFEIDAPASTGESNIDYSRVPTAYKQQAADAVSNSEIPAGYRNAVRDYFESINFGADEDAE